MEKLVLRLPKWQGELVFSEEILIFVGVILLMVVGILFCFWGYKYFRTILFMGIGVVTCYGSYRLVAPMTANSAVRMFLTVSLTFLGICFVYFLSIIWGYILDRLRIRAALGKRTYLLAAPAGAAILGLTIYYMVWRDEIAAGVIAAVCLVTGLIFQHTKRKKQVRFRSYDDLIRLPRPQFDEDAPVLVSAVTVNAAEPVSEPDNIAPETVKLEPERVTLECAEPESESSTPELIVTEQEKVMPAESQLIVSERADLSACALESAVAAEIAVSAAESAAPEPVVSEAAESESECSTPELIVAEQEKVVPAESQLIVSERADLSACAPESAVVAEIAVSAAESAAPESESARAGAVKDANTTNVLNTIEATGTRAYQESNLNKGKTHGHKRKLTRADRRHAFPMAFAGGAALIAVVLGFLIANKVLKGGED